MLLPQWHYGRTKKRAKTAYFRLKTVSRYGKGEKTPRKDKTIIPYKNHTEQRKRSSGSKPALPLNYCLFVFRRLFYVRKLRDVGVCNATVVKNYQCIIALIAQMAVQPHLAHKLGNLRLIGDNR